jgi:hypothetical protein
MIAFHYRRCTACTAANTMKTQVQSTYPKLNIATRVEACGIARALKLN